MAFQMLFHKWNDIIPRVDADFFRSESLFKQKYIKNIRMLFP